jgi:S-formylglutathione hydrolase FrmB
MVGSFLMLCGILNFASINLAQEGTLKWSEIRSPALENNLLGDPAIRPFAIYLPPSYEASEKLEKRYPVIYVLHGSTGNANSMTYLKPTIDRMTQNGEIGELIAVFVDGSNKFTGSWYLSSKTIGDYETYIVRDLVKHIDANYRTIAHRNSRGITGLSMGGYGSMHLALKYPEVFSSVVAQAGHYHRDGSWKIRSESIAALNPKDFVEMNRLSFIQHSGFTLAAAIASNPAKPPFFLDKPFELVDGKVTVVPEIWKRYTEADIFHGHLERYIKQPIRLNGIMFVHGVADGLTPVELARALDKAMIDLGIEHVYDEHTGGHSFNAEKALKFLSDHLAFKPTPAVNVKPHGKLTTTWGGMKRSR